MPIDTVEEFWSPQQLDYALDRVSSDSCDVFRHKFAKFLGISASSCWMMPSAHQGLSWLIQSSIDPRPIIMAPAFNCPVVKDAISVAGKLVQLYDFSPRIGVFDWDLLIRNISPKVGTIIVTHYFGIPVDFSPLLSYCTEHNISIIEDCAHTLGATINSKSVGTIGDASIFSFNYDKPISLGWGGVVVVNNPLKFPFASRVRYTELTNQDEYKLLQSFVSSMLARRRSIPYQRSYIYRACKKFNPLKSLGFRNTGEISIGPVQAELGIWCLERYKQIIAIRNNNAFSIASEISQDTWPIAHGVTPAFIKQKINTGSISAMNSLSNAMQRNGIRVGNFNWPYLLSPATLRSHPLAAQVSNHWVDVPIHQSLDSESIDEIVGAFNRLI